MNTKNSAVLDNGRVQLGAGVGQKGTGKKGSFALLPATPRRDSSALASRERGPAKG